MFCLFCFLVFLLVKQTKSKLLKIYCISEYIDGYVIKAVDTINLDTLDIISAKETIINQKKYRKLLVGKEYNFEYNDYVSSAAAVATTTTQDALYDYAGATGATG